ncbi:inositol monophosphatase 3-like [Plakobranchus ocellatus]|uniref:inositol-phosphate phosphatase n=1 Tax=Plakobranchus ocellatus TaxID=259542 RepID=A0AAV3Y822_9GAST|nr:inositol monophosphatase 3-like [Plakobranchus ocellatus]
MAPSNLRLNPWGALVFIVGFFLALGYMFGPPDFFRKEQRVSMRELLSVSIGLASKGGVKVKEIHEEHKLKEKVKGQTKEGAKEMITVGDLESHKIIFYGFSKMYPGIKVVSEEHDNKPVDFNQVSAVDTNLPEVQEVITSDQSIPVSDIAIWIDPLDATQEYTESLTQFVTTMVCVVVRGEPKIGVINKPFTGETIWAWSGYGHSKNLEIGTSPRDTRQQSLIVSRSHKGDVETMSKSAFGDDVKIIGAGGAGYKVLEVVKGSVNAYTHVTAIKKWDICAGNAILNALGGKMTTLDGDFINYSPNLDPKNERGLLATVNNRLHYEYLEKLGAKAKEILEEKSSSHKTK